MLLSFADDDLQDQLDDVQTRMAEQSEKKAQAQMVIDNVSDKLYEIQKSLEAAQGEYRTVTADLAATEEKIAATQAELDENRARLEKREKVFTRRIRDVYMHGQLSYLDVVLGAKDFSDFSNRLELLRRVVDADISLISDIRRERAAIEAAQKELEVQRDRQAKLRDEAKAKRDEIASHKEEQQAVLYQAQTDKATAEKAYAEYQQASQSIAEMLRQRASAEAQPAPAASDSSDQGESSDAGSSQPSGGGGTGAMIWPVNGVITSPYGYRTHPIFGTTIYHSGIDIGVDYGTLSRPPTAGLSSKPAGSAAMAMPSSSTTATACRPCTATIRNSPFPPARASLRPGHRLRRSTGNSTGSRPLRSPRQWRPRRSAGICLRYEV